MSGFSDLIVYKKSLDLAMEIFNTSKNFPMEEMYSLTDQIRRSSRSANICLIEAYRKRRYRAHFISKLTDSDMENSETGGWLRFSVLCQYITEEKYISLVKINEEIGKLLSHMINHPEKYGSV